MSSSDPTSRPGDVFEQIEDALRSTPHGRAFLAECGRRARSEETALLLDAVARLERQAQTSRSDQDPNEVRTLLVQADSALREARHALRGSFSSAVPCLAAEPPSAASFGRETTTAIVAAAELIQETAWVMREAGFDIAICDRLDEQTSAIHAACRRQERMLDGLSAVERAIARADGHVGDLLRLAAAPPAPPALQEGTPATFLDEDIAFAPVREGTTDGPDDIA
jgi:hypothetical protein